jgi:hypothetical protein
MAEYDLTHRLSKFLDRHLVFPLLEFLSARGTYDAKSIQVRRWWREHKTKRAPPSTTP